jgi:hypothetical protein
MTVKEQVECKQVKTRLSSYHWTRGKNSLSLKLVFLTLSCVDSVFARVNSIVGRVVVKSSFGFRRFYFMSRSLVLENSVDGLECDSSLITLRIFSACENND